VVLVDGERWHASLVDRATDARQQAALERAGFVVVRISAFEVWHDVDTVVRKVSEGWREVAGTACRSRTSEVRRSA
jgi:very-short-patch-repair endonuclease